MNKKFTNLALMCALALGTTVSNVQADVILTTSSATYIGNFNPDTPASTQNEVTYVNQLISLTPGVSQTVAGRKYTRSNNIIASLPTALLAGADQVVTSNGTGINTSGFTYLLAKNGTGGWVWDVAGLGTVDIPGVMPRCGRGCGGGLSHYVLFTTAIVIPHRQAAVPDGGSPAMLLGGALVALETLRRRITA